MPDIGNTIQNTTIDTLMGAAVGESAGEIATDIVLDELIDALVNEYAKASIQMQEKCDAHFSKYLEEDKKKRALLDEGKISKDEYRTWQSNKLLGTAQWASARDTLAQDLTHCNEIAADIINDRKCDVYALNHNYGAYEIEHDTGAYTSYTLYDHNTVERLISQKPELLPKTKIDIPKDLLWNQQQLTSAVTQGILQGESIPAIAKRMASVTDMSKNAAIRNARTATTGAQNAGRVESYKRAEKMGIKVTQVWISTLDGRTRTSHRHMMGEKRPLGKLFSNKCRFPGDPQGPGWEVYNCRCTLIAEPDGSGYDLEKTIDKNLSKKGMTFDEWVNEQPLPRHYGESKQHYLERYAKHKKQLSFNDWLGEQAAPDAVIQSVWGDKKMSQMYNEIKAQNVTDANKFYKELGKLGKPSEVWEKYLTGQLDAEDMKNFEDILKKYLPQQNVGASASVAAVKYEGKISKEAQDSLDKLKFKAGNPMDKDAADNYKVNPFYDKADKATTKNCQTSAFAYECRRQGYDVVALPKYGLNINDPELDKILQLQNELGKNARLGWINKTTGQPATAVIEHTDPMLIMSKADMIKELEDAIGTSGERYIMGVRWKGTGAHAINIDRTPDGKLRIIDNQRGPLEKNTWVGKEVEDYLNKVQRIRHVTRVDDCVPNAEYFNKIVVDAKKVKADLPSNVSSFKDYSKLAKQAKDAGEKTSVYYTKWKAGLIDNAELDKLVVVKKVDDLAEIKKTLPNTLGKLSQENLDLYNKVQGKISPVVPSNMTKNEYWQKYLNADIINTDLDDLLKGLNTGAVKLSDDVTQDLTKFLTAVEKQDAVLAEKIWNHVDNKLTVKHGLASDTVWEKYLKGEIKDSDLDDMVKAYGIKPKTDLDVYKADLLKDPKLADKLDDIAIAAIKDNQLFTNDYLKAYLKGEKQNDYLDDLLKKQMPSKAAPTATADNIVDIAKKELGDTLNNDHWMGVYLEVAGIDSDLAHELKDIATNIKNNEGFGNKYDVLNAYFNGTLKNAELDDIFTKIYKDKIPTATATTASTFDKTAALSKYDSYTDLKWDLLDVGGEDLFNKIDDELLKLHLNDPSSSVIGIYDKYKNGEISSKKLDDLFDEAIKKLNPAPTPVPTTAVSFKTPEQLEKLKDFTDQYKKFQLDNSIYAQVAQGAKSAGISDHVKYWEKYVKGEIDDPDLDVLLGLKKESTATGTTVVDLDAIKGKKVTAIYNEIKADIGSSEANAFYNKTLKEIGSKNKLSQGEVWKKYLSGDLDADDVKKIDDHLIKKYSKTVEPPKPTFDKSAFDTKKMSQVYNDIKATDTATANKFYNDLKKMGKPSEVWDEYLKGNLSQDKVDIIETHLKKKYTTAPSAKVVAGAAEKSDDLIKAEETLKKAQDNLSAAEKALKDNIPDYDHVYKGIWKDPVTLDDYEKKKSTIAAKKIYYEEEINKLKTDPDYKSWLDSSAKDAEIHKLEAYLYDLEEYDKLGQKAEKYLDDINKAKNAVTDAKQKVQDLTPVGEAFTQERKDAAKWFTSKSYKDGDKYYTNLSATKDAHKSATSAEHHAYIEYTSASGGFNRPLAGFKAPQYSGGSGWDEKYYKGVGNVPLDNENKGKDIKNLTSFVEKSKMEDDIWVQTAQNYATLEGKNGFLGVPYGALSGMTDKELQQFVGVENQLGQFISASINRGGGSYTPGNMRINIYCPKGSEALYVLSDGTYGKSEHEIILQRGGTYKVSKIYWGTDAEHGGKKLIVDLELRLEKGYNKYEK